MMLLLSANPPHYSLPNPTLLTPNKPLQNYPFKTPFFSSKNLPYSPYSSTCTSSTLRYVNDPLLEQEEEGGEWVPSAYAVASAIKKASSCPIDFTHSLVKDPNSQGIVLPSPDFQRLCLDQLALFRSIVHPNALLSVYVRPAGSYVMDRLELRRVTFYPTVDGSEIVILVCNFNVPAGLRAAESVLSNLQAEAIPEYRAVVFPLVKHPFVVGFLVAELPSLESGTHDGSHIPSPEECYALPPSFDFKSPNISGNTLTYFNLSADQRLNAINISRSLAMAYVMDQKAMLLQQTSWQNNIRMSNLVEQIRGPLSSLRSLSKLLSLQIKRNEIAHDLIENILVQSDQMRDTLQQLQDAVLLTKANIMRFNEESLKRLDGSDCGEPEKRTFRLPNDLSTNGSADKTSNFDQKHSLSLPVKDLEMPMPPLALAPLRQHSIRPCNVTDVVVDLVGAAQPLARNQKRRLELNEFTPHLPVAVEEPALRQALGNLIEGALLRTHVGGRVEVVSVGAPAGGALVVIDDNGPDMHYMTQMHSLTPFGAELFSDQMMEDNMTWNFVAGLTVAREILESYGCVLRVVSPRDTDAALGSGGTRVEVWLPSSTPYNHSTDIDGDIDNKV